MRIKAMMMTVMVGLALLPGGSRGSDYGDAVKGMMEFDVWVYNDYAAESLRTNHTRQVRSRDVESINHVAVNGQSLLVHVTTSLEGKQEHVRLSLPMRKMRISDGDMRWKGYSSAQWQDVAGDVDAEWRLIPGDFVKGKEMSPEAFAKRYKDGLVEPVRAGNVSVEEAFAGLSEENPVALIESPDAGPVLVTYDSRTGNYLVLQGYWGSIKKRSWYGACAGWVAGGVVAFPAVLLAVGSGGLLTGVVTLPLAMFTPFFMILEGGM